MEALTPAFVRVPKTGSTSVTAALFGDRDWPHCKASELERGPRVFCFGFVRDPYTRCLSAFNWFRHRTSAKWTQPMRDLPFSEWVIRNLDVTITGFDPQSAYFDAPVDFIGRYESLDADFAHILSVLGRPQVELPRMNTTVFNDPGEYTDAARRVVREAYAEDFTRFGYN